MKAKILSIILAITFIWNTTASTIPIYAQTMQEQEEITTESTNQVPEPGCLTAIPEDQAEIIGHLYNIEDVELMAKTVWAEARNQDLKGKKLIADVILNRLDSKRFPDTVEEVIVQSGQFASGDYFTENELYAVLLELRKEREHRTDPNIVFFRTDYYHPFGIPAYKYGDHFFNIMG